VKLKHTEHLISRKNKNFILDFRAQQGARRGSVIRPTNPILTSPFGLGEISQFSDFLSDEIYYY
jgi:hypothetical protein